uniref:HTH psq-type domain-containing protein n=1 Tax=Photinus pyralis TaxID=7054 RepID=A0A1Y1KPP3_PHOPY
MPGSHNTKRRKVGARTYRNFSNEQLEKAIDEVKSGKLSIRNASEKFSIPKSTIARKVKQKNMNDPGHPTALTQKDENIIVEKIIQAGKWGFPFSRLDIQRIVKAHLDKSGFKN